MGTSSLIILKLAEERYAEDSGNAYSMAEEEAQRTNIYPVAYPEPFYSIGCGYGPLNDYVRKQCNAVASELGLDADFCIQSELAVTLHCGATEDYAKFTAMLGERLEAVKGWITNASQLWADDQPKKSLPGQPENQALTQQVKIGVFAATLAVDAEGHLSVVVKSLDGSRATYLTNVTKAEDEVSIRVSTVNIEAAVR